ncbi:metal ABC transporter permease [Spirochaeta cellobiosiphila]|uniref:metal ABC transporter permease n=1 Tax=Spirochaeta cellobiosiphila TaxID=504483 RepID=UPI00041428D5|nr:metal ABC transporter permease [Spirochaeta cellobiosiphila]
MIFEILFVAVLVSMACAIPGVFLVLRKMSLMSDAISHAVLPGIVLGFLLTHSLSSPLLFIGAVFTGILTVFLSELLVKTSLVKEDAAIGLVFPVLFSIGVILVSLFTGDVHLDTDAVLLGELVFTPLDRISVMGWDLGPRMAWIMGLILLINLSILFLLFKELKLATFDKGLATSLGFSPVLIQYILMTDVSITTVGAFDAVGSILVVALIVAPASAAYLLTDDLKMMVLLSIIIGVLSSISGFYVAWFMDASASGAIAGMCGVFFLLAFLFAPSRGIVVQYQRKRGQKLDFAMTLLTVHIMHHQGKTEEINECSVNHLTQHINWDSVFAKSVVTQAQRKGLINIVKGIITLTSEGRERADQAMI